MISYLTADISFRCTLVTDRMERRQGKGAAADTTAASRDRLGAQQQQRASGGGASPGAPLLHPRGGDSAATPSRPQVPICWRQRRTVASDGLV